MQVWTAQILCLAPTLASATIARAAPQAATVPKSWQLDFEFQDPKRLTLAPLGQPKTSYWYVLYRVTNNTGRDVPFYPSIRLVTDTLDVVVAGDDVNPQAYDVIAATHKREFPFLAPPASVTGLLLQGEENARTTVAVFRAFDSRADSFTIHVGGLSGEIVRIANPAFDRTQEESKSNARAFFLRRTLAIHYDIPGDASTSGLHRPIRRSREWVMR